MKCIVHKLKKLDFMLLFILCCLIAIGTMAIYVATANTNLSGLHVNSLVLFGVFCIPMLILAFMDYRILLGKLAYIAYGIGIVLLILVKLQGVSINGAVRWLIIGSYQLQPSELVKISTIMLAAHLLYRRRGERLRLLQDIIPVCLVFMVPTYLIFDQPDLGTALVFIGIFVGMLWMGNIHTAYMLISGAVVSFTVWLVYWLFQTENPLLEKILKGHQISRIHAFLDPASDPEKSWHVTNAMNAIGVGGVFGDDGYYLKQGFIPYAYSDSIYVAIAENYGFAASAVLLLLFFIMVYRMVIAVHESRDLAGSYLVTGLICMLVFQVFVNIGMHIGLLPLTGLSLPFISYGGSSLFTNMLAMGIVLSVSLHRRQEKAV